MSTKTVARLYDQLTAEERFRLCVAAGDRNDEAEQHRLAESASRISLKMPDYAPWSHAFGEVMMLVYIEVSDEISRYEDAFHRWCDADETLSEESDIDADDAEEANDEPGASEQTDGEESEAPDKDERGSRSRRMRDLYLAQGFVLWTKAAGWKLFCERLGFKPFGLWQYLPGFARLQSVLEVLENAEYRQNAAFEPAAMLRWLRRVPSNKEARPTPESIITPEHFADDLDKMLRQRAKWWGG